MTATDPPAQRIAGLTNREAPLWVRALFALQRRRYGVVLEPTRLWARAPAALRGFVDLFAGTDRAASPLEPPLRSLVMVRVSQINACSYCVDINASFLLERGISTEKALAVADHETSEAFSEKERAALTFAVEMTETGPGVSDATFFALREHFSDDEIVELTALVAMQNASSKFNAALRIPPQGFCPALRPAQ